MLISAAMAQWQMHRIGHDRDPHAALKGVGNFTPPILGRVKVANFEITTGFGSWRPRHCRRHPASIRRRFPPVAAQPASLAGRHLALREFANHAELVV